MKRCCSCKEEKDESKFGKNRNAYDGLQGKCKLCSSAYKKEYYRKHAEAEKEYGRVWGANRRRFHPELIAEQKQRYIDKLGGPEGYKLENRRKCRKWKYNLTEDDFKALWDSQNGNCYLCGGPLSDVGYGRHDAQVEHCHITGYVRGIAHGTCNRGIGVWSDDPDIMQLVVNNLRLANEKVKEFDREYKRSLMLS